MLILGLESSCDETAASVVSVEDGRFIAMSNIVSSQIETHRLYGGVVPEIASRAHTEAISRVTREALTQASVSLPDIDVIAVTSHPGLIGALLVAVNFAKGLAAATGKPLVAVDHMKAHIAAVYLGETYPTAPFIALALSGGHTCFYHVETPVDYRVIGSTGDDAIGEAFDKIGRLIGIPYPAGAGFDALAAEGFVRATGKNEGGYAAYGKSKVHRDPAFRLPSPALAGENLDFSFSGLKTAAINLLHRLEAKGEPLDRALFAAQYTYEAVEAVAQKTAMALAQYPGLPLCVSGGVAANSHLRARLDEVCRHAGVGLYIPPRSLCGDNGAMVAAQGYYDFMAGRIADASLNASALDEA